MQIIDARHELARLNVGDLVRTVGPKDSPIGHVPHYGCIILTSGKPKGSLVLMGEGGYYTWHRARDVVRVKKST